MSKPKQEDASNEPVTVQATLTRVFWQQDRRVIASVRPPKGRQYTVIGDLTEPHIGQLYDFTGTWRYNDRYGAFDLNFTSYRTILPEDASGAYHYLVNTAKWVGPANAKKLIDAFGDKTLMILKTDRAAVIAAGIKGLTPERIAELSDTLIANEKLEDAMVETGQMIGGLLGGGAVQAAIYRWGSDAPHIIKRDPFRLTALPGVGFARADSIYAKLGLDPKAKRRHAHAAIYGLQEQARRSGHTRVSPLTFETDWSRLVGTPNAKAGQLCERARKIVRADTFVADGALHEAEKAIASKLTAIKLQNLPKLDMPAAGAGEIASELDGLQRTAFDMAMESPLTILTGAPGTGKTFVLARILKAWTKAGLHVALAAPTGKAAKQMERAMADVMPAMATTIHSLLDARMEDGEFGFARNEQYPIECSGLIIDETSMVDVRLMRSLTRAIPEDCRVMFVGDHHQLPSVGPGAILRDMLTAGLPAIELTEIRRNAGTIVRACHAIKNGSLTPQPDAKLDLDNGHNWRHLEAHSEDRIGAVIEALLGWKLAEFGVDPLWGTQIISPTNESGGLSCKALNRVAKQVLNPGPPAHNLAFGVGDKVVRMKNGTAVQVGIAGPCWACEGKGAVGAEGTKCSTCDGKGVATSSSRVRIVNGDIGIIKGIDKRFVYVNFLYPNRSVQLPRSDHKLKQAFCMTCHKMQGSEIDVIILPVRRETVSMPMVTREWVYTAISRAKRFIITIGEIDHLPMALRRIGNLVRTTGLVEHLEALPQC